MPVNAYRTLYAAIFRSCCACSWIRRVCSPCRLASSACSWAWCWRALLVHVRVAYDIIFNNILNRCFIIVYTDSILALPWLQRCNSHRSTTVPVRLVALHLLTSRARTIPSSDLMTPSFPLSVKGIANRDIIRRRLATHSTIGFIKIRN